MESEKKVIEDILKISMEIQEFSPELSKFIEEIVSHTNFVLIQLWQNHTQSVQKRSLSDRS